MSKTIKINLKNTFLALSALTIVSCGYSDYPGLPGHKTKKEAYVPELTTVISGYGDKVDGTYVYSVRYDNSKWQNKNFKFKSRISSYRNVVIFSEPNRPGMYVDADKFNKAKGFSGGKFKRYWVATDLDQGQVGGLDNFDKSHPLDENGKWIEPMLVLALNSGIAEIDNFDMDLQSSIKNAGNLLGNIIENGGSMQSLSLEIKAIEINQQKVAVSPYKLDLSLSRTGLSKIVLNNQPATASVVNAILDNSEHMKKVDLKLHFSNGMEIAIPKQFSVMFNHTALQTLVK